MTDSDTGDFTGFDGPTLCRLVAEGLGMLHRLSNVPPIRVKDVTIDDTSLSVDFYAESRDMLSVKVEIGKVAAGLSGLLEGSGRLSATPIYHYGIRAWDEDGVWLMYAVCSAEAAKEIGRGNGMDWLRATHFQENTPDWRLARAKALTSRTEIGLRDVTNQLLSVAEGPAWWSRVMTGPLKKIGSEAEGQAKREGSSDPSSRELLNFTYLRDISSIIDSRWELFSGLWPDRDVFIENMRRLNVLRRSEAHNRPIASARLKELESLSEAVIDGIARLYPQVVPEYLVEKWKYGLLRISEKLTSSWGPGDVRRDMTENTESLRRFAKTATSVLPDAESIAVPAGREDIHARFVESLRLAANSSQEMVDAGDGSDWVTLKRQSKVFERAMSGIREFEEYIVVHL